MRVKLMPGDWGACGYYRMRLPAEALAHDTDLEIITIDNESDPHAFTVFFQGGPNTPKAVSMLDPDCDVVVLQRPARRMMVETIPLIQEAGTAVVVEIDDDLDTIHPKNPAWRAYNPGTSPESNSMWLKLACNLADLVTCSTPAIARRYGTHGRVRILPNYLPRRYLEIGRARTDDPAVIGWPGSPKVHPGDLEVIGHGVRDVLLSSPEWRFHAIGGAGTLRKLGVPEDQGEVTEWVDLETYPTEVSKLGVGIAPLEKTPFNRAKSWLRALEYAALGVPFVASDIAEYAALNRLGAGVLADGPTTWTRALQQLVDNADRRQELRARGLEVAAGLVIDDHAHEWRQAWADAISVRRSS